MAKKSQISEPVVEQQTTVVPIVSFTKAEEKLIKSANHFGQVRQIVERVINTTTYDAIDKEWCRVILLSKASSINPEKCCEEYTKEDALKLGFKTLATGETTTINLTSVRATKTIKIYSLTEEGVKIIPIAFMKMKELKPTILTQNNIEED